MESPGSNSAAYYRGDSAAASSGVSWGAIAAAAFVGAALALILLLLGSGLGFTALSPWASEGVSAKTVGFAALAWLVFTHLASSAITGYMAGRLRTKWSDVHTDEVYFRDTAHGLTAWAVGIVLTAAFLTGAASQIVGGTARGAMTAVGGAAAGAGMAAGGAAQKSGGTDTNAYFVDSLFRSDRPRGPDDTLVREEATRIFASGMQQTELPAGDRTYLAQIVSSRTGLAQPDAEKRVTDVMAQAKAAETKARQAADTARKAAAHLSLWMFLALLIGAFTASYTATMGGRTRDDAVVTPTRSLP